MFATNSIPGGWGSGSTTILPNGCILKCPPSLPPGWCSPNCRPPGWCPPNCNPSWPPNCRPPGWCPPNCNPSWPPNCRPPGWCPPGGGGWCPPGCCCSSCSGNGNNCNGSGNGWCPPGCCCSSCCNSGSNGNGNGNGGAGGNGPCPPDQCSCPSNPWVDCSAVFGGMYRSSNNTMHLSSGANGQTISLDAPFPLQNVGFSGNSTLGIQCSGTYELTFFGNFSFSSDTVLMFYVTANGTRLDETIVLKSAIANDDTTFERSVIVRLCANTSLLVC